MLYYYGRVDYLLSTRRLGEQQPIANRVRFVPDFRTDVPIIPDRESFELVLNCHASSLFVTQVGYWVTGQRTRADVEDVATLIFDRATPLSLLAESRLVAFVWNHEVPTPRPVACDVLLR